MPGKFILYIDDTGSRDPDAELLPSPGRRDGMDCFGLGGVLVREEDVDDLLRKHQAFCSTWGIDYPLHSSRIRGRRGKFSWLRNTEDAEKFLPALQDLLMSLPFVGIACVVNRPGYVYRYKERYDKLWFMCKTTFCILIERAAKFANDDGRKLEIYFEESGKKEDRDIVRYMRDLKREGNPFNEETSKIYMPLTAEDYRGIVLGEPRRRTKLTPPMQIADLVLYPIAKGVYDPTYHPFTVLKESGKLIDSLLPYNEIQTRGIKYSCFDS